tara:strand:+ start:573 stop:773 length:201 start_codon:yes stop_codon:yes gene_type:complete
MQFDNIKYLYGCLDNEKSKLNHLLQAANSSNYDVNNPIIKRQEQVIRDLITKIKNCESKEKGHKAP